MSGQMAYAWKPNSRHSIPAQVAGEEISRIRSEKGTFFSPGDIVESAREEHSPLHPEFEWDDHAAAESYRVEQAKYMIRCVVVLHKDDPQPEPIRAFVSVKSAEGHRYTTTAYAFSQPDLREQVLAQAEADMVAFHRKYSQYMDLSKVMAAFKSSKMEAESEFAAAAE